MTCIRPPRIKHPCLESGEDPLATFYLFFSFLTHLLSTVPLPSSLIFSRRERQGGKSKSGRSFGLSVSFQLPYLMDGKNKLTQSNAILRYIARKHNMCEWGRADEMRAAHLGEDEAAGDFSSFGLQVGRLKKKRFEWTSWRTK